MREIKADTNKWKEIHVHELEELILLRCQYYPKQSTDSMQFLSYYQWHFSQNWNKKNLKIFMKIKKTLKSQNTMEKEEQMWRNDAP